MAESQAPETSLARDTLLLAAGFASGGLAAIAIAMVGAVGRDRGGEEATWLHLSVLIAAMSMVVVVGALRGTSPGFPQPLKSWPVIACGAAGFGAIAAISLQGIAWYYLFSGLISVAVFLLVTWLVVRVNLALYMALNTLGTVVMSLLLDAIGAFGAPEQGITVTRLAGVLLIAAGVVIVRAK